MHMFTDKHHKHVDIFVIALLVLNLLLFIYIGFFKKDAYWLETLKAWWKENMKMATQLYKSSFYVQQQKSTLEQILSSINQAGSTPSTLDTMPSNSDITSSGDTTVSAGAQ